MMIMWASQPTATRHFLNPPRFGESQVPVSVRLDQNAVHTNSDCAKSLRLQGGGKRPKMRTVLRCSDDKKSTARSAEREE